MLKMKKILQDINGKPSGARCLLYGGNVLIFAMAVYSIYTGNDIGGEMAELLKSAIIGIDACCGASMSAEKLGKKKND